MPRTLYDYQKNALARAYNASRFALFFEMRLGKTLVVIRRLRRMQGPFLIVAPNDALISWKKELTTEKEPFLDITSGTAKERDFDLIAGLQDFFHLQRPRYFLVNKEAFLVIPRIAAAPWEAVILDESTFIKSPKAKVTKFFLRNFKSTPVKGILAGIPDPESRLDYIPQLLFLEPKWLGVKTYWDFRAKYCVPDGFDWMLSLNGSKILNEALKNCHTLKRHEVGLDRKKIYEQRSVKLPPALRRIYNEVIKNFMLEYKDICLDTKTAVQAFTWLRQLASGLIAGELVFPDKIEVVKRLLSGELKRQPVIIWTNLVQENIQATAALQQVYGARVSSISGATPPKERAIILKSFDNGDLDYLVIQVPCATFGLNLSHASAAIYLSCPFGYLPRKQSEDRILDVKGKEPLLYIDIVTEDSVDEDILKGIADKQSAQDIKRNIIRSIDARHKQSLINTSKM